MTTGVTIKVIDTGSTQKGKEWTVKYTKLKMLFVYLFTI